MLFLQHADLRGHFSQLAFQRHHAQFQFHIFQPSDNRVLLDKHTWLDTFRNLFESARHCGVDGRSIARLDVEVTGNVERKRDEQKDTDQGGDHGRRRDHTDSLHFMHPPRHIEKFAQLPHRLNHQTKEAHGAKQASHDLESVRFEYLVQEHQDGKHHNPTIEDCGNGIEAEKELVPLRQKRVLRLFDSQTQSDHEPLQHFGRLLSQVRNFDQVHQNVIAIKSQQRVAVKQQGADRTDEHQTEANLVQQ